MKIAVKSSLNLQAEDCRLKTGFNGVDAISNKQKGSSINYFHNFFCLWSHLPDAYWAAAAASLLLSAGTQIPPPRH
jgi:hypothetical protein